MPKKRIMIIGAGEFQAKGIEKAKAMGLYVIATDGNPKAPGFMIADRFEILDVKDTEAHLKLAKTLKLDAVLSIANDVALNTVNAVANECGLRTTSLQAINASLNKRAQREIFLKNGLPQPRFAIAHNYREAEDALKKIGLPAVLKPVDNSGSRGVYMLQDKTELEQQVEEALNFSSVKELILEEFVEGTECTIEGISINSHHHILAISDKYKPENKFRVATELCYPARISYKLSAETKSMMKKAYTAMGIDFAPTHSEVIISKNGPVIIEVSCRGGGFYVFTDIVEATSSVDIVSLWIRICLGEDPKLPRLQKRAVVLRFFAPRAGRLRAISGTENLDKIDGLRYGFFLQPGDKVPELRSDGSRTGFLISQASNVEEALNKADRAMASVQFDIESEL